MTSLRAAALFATAIAVVVALSWSASAETGSDVDAGDLSGTATGVESPSEQPASRSRPYAFGQFSAGRCNHGFTVLGGGGGGEGFPLKRLGLGGDVGFYHFVDDTSFGLASFNVALHFGETSEGSRLDPFLKVSPGFYFAEGGGGGALGAGGGFNYWLKDRMALRADLRFQLVGTEEGLILFEVGISFR